MFWHKLFFITILSISTISYAGNSLTGLKSQQFKQKNFDKKRIYDLNIAQQEKLLKNSQKLHSNKHIYNSFLVYTPIMEYPRIAKMKGIQQGSVTLSFDINRQGKAENIKVLHSTSEYFIRNAKKVVRRSVFDTRVFDGLPKLKTFRAKQTIKYK